MRSRRSKRHKYRPHNPYSFVCCYETYCRRWIGFKEALKGTGPPDCKNCLKRMAKEEAK